MKPISPFGLPVGISTSFWFIVGLIRFISNVFRFPKKLNINKLNPSDVAVLVPAHNEEVVIRSCIQALKKSIDKKQIYVVSDGSTDKTYRRARQEGCHVSCLEEGRGKAKSMIYLLNHYNLFEKYKLIFIVDADTRIHQDFIKKALFLLEDEDISVVFGSARINWPRHFFPKLGLYFIAYRERLNRMLQFFLIYGQTWKFTNVNYVIPGFAAIYKSKVLQKLQIDTPGLLIEDFNLAFQLHRKKLGKIGYEPYLIGWDQHPDNLSDYWKQVKRWNIGFFQTVKKNGIWPSFFWLSLAIFTFEVFLNSIFILSLPFLVIISVLSWFPDFNLSLGILLNLKKTYLLQSVNFQNLILFIFLYDYILSVIIGLIYKKPQFLFYGLFFFFMHYVTSLILLSSIIPGFFGNSNGRWNSPKRMEV